MYVGTPILDPLIHVHDCVRILHRRYIENIHSACISPIGKGCIHVVYFGRRLFLKHNRISLHSLLQIVQYMFISVATSRKRSMKSSLNG